MVGMFDMVLLLPLEGKPGQKSRLRLGPKDSYAPGSLTPECPGAGTRPVEGGPSHPPVP